MGLLPARRSRHWVSPRGGRGVTVCPHGSRCRWNQRVPEAANLQQRPTRIWGEPSQFQSTRSFFLNSRTWSPGAQWDDDLSPTGPPVRGTFWSPRVFASECIHFLGRIPAQVCGLPSARIRGGDGCQQLPGLEAETLPLCTHQEHGSGPPTPPGAATASLTCLQLHLIPQAPHFTC